MLQKGIFFRQRNGGVLDLFSKVPKKPSFPRRREPKCDSPQALRKKAKQLARKLFRLSYRAAGDSHLDTRLRGHDAENSSWPPQRPHKNRAGMVCGNITATRRKVL